MCARNRLRETNTSCQEMVQRVVKSSCFYWTVIVFVLLNTVCLAVEHHGQPVWMDDMLSECDDMHIVGDDCGVSVRVFGL